MSSSLQTLSELLTAHYHKKTVILIDEYDVPLDKALQQIHERRYPEYLLNDDRKDIRLYGIAFCKKRCRAISEKFRAV